MVKLKYEYDGNNLRQSKTTNGVKTSHIYDGQNIVLDVTENGNTVYNRGLTLINRTNQNGTDYYHFNIHGDTIALTNLLGEITVNYQYDAFGNQLTNTENDTNPFRYCGEYFDTETGFIYLRNRYYDPSLGRFVTEDPIKDGMNWYVYCGNNPVVFVDPLGLWEPGDETDRTLEIAQSITGKNTVTGYNVPMAWVSTSNEKLGLGILKGQSQFMGILATDTIKYSIDKGDPLGILYRNKNSGHWVVMIGYASAEGHEFLVVSNDPWGGKNNVETYDDFKAHDDGRVWTYTSW